MNNERMTNEEKARHKCGNGPHGETRRKRETLYTLHDDGSPPEMV